MTGNPSSLSGLSIIIVALNARVELARLLARLKGTADEIVVVDGGSRDGSAALAAREGAVVVHGARGRGAQLAAGAAAARGTWLMFLHADGCPGEGWREEVEAFMGGSGNRWRGGVFRLVWDEPRRWARWLEFWVGVRCRLLKLPYGDQGLVMGRAFYCALGGFRALPLMEDVDMVRRIGGRRLVFFATPMRTSAARYRADGVVWRVMRNGLCLVLYYFRVPPRVLARLYG